MTTTTSPTSRGKRHALLALLVLLITTTIGSIPILLIGLIKLIPYSPLKKQCTRWVDAIATWWCDINNTYLNHMHTSTMQITGLSQFNPKDWYLVIANHQSWLDIVILQRLFNRKIPVLKFFIKDQLKWIPLLGFSWWAMGCPFMKRYSRDYLIKNPHKKGSDVKATQKAIQSFKQLPGTLMSFVEGTRYTPQKKLQQQSPYQHLLKPKAGGIGMVLGAMHQQIKQILDVTIIYPNQEHSLWHFLCHRIDSIQIHIRQIAVPPQFLTDSLLDNEQMQSEFRQWLNEQWLEKDHLITMMNKA